MKNFKVSLFRERRLIFFEAPGGLALQPGESGKKRLRKLKEKIEAKIPPAAEAEIGQVRLIRKDLWVKTEKKGGGKWSTERWRSLSNVNMDKYKHMAKIIPTPEEVPPAADAKEGWMRLGKKGLRWYKLRNGWFRLDGKRKEAYGLTNKEMDERTAMIIDRLEEIPLAAGEEIGRWRLDTVGVIWEKVKKTKKGEWRTTDPNAKIEWLDNAAMNKRTVINVPWTPFPERTEVNGPETTVFKGKGIKVTSRGGGKGLNLLYKFYKEDKLILAKYAPKGAFKPSVAPQGALEYVEQRTKREERYWAGWKIWKISVPKGTNIEFNVETFGGVQKFGATNAFELGSRRTGFVISRNLSTGDYILKTRKHQISYEYKGAKYSTRGYKEKGIAGALTVLGGAMGLNYRYVLNKNGTVHNEVTQMDTDIPLYRHIKSEDGTETILHYRKGDKEGEPTGLKLKKRDKVFLPGEFPKASTAKKGEVRKAEGKLWTKTGGDEWKSEEDDGYYWGNSLMDERTEEIINKKTITFTIYDKKGKEDKPILTEVMDKPTATGINLFPGYGIAERWRHIRFKRGGKTIEIQIAGKYAYRLFKGPNGWLYREYYDDPTGILYTIFPGDGRVLIPTYVVFNDGTVHKIPEDAEYFEPSREPVEAPAPSKIQEEKPKKKGGEPVEAPAPSKIQEEKSKKKGKEPLEAPAPSKE